jgi:type I restriction enzyme R subunit
MLAEYGISFMVLASAANQPEADFFDLLCYVAFNAPLLTRRERANRLRRKETDFFNQYGETARTILNALLDKYAEHGADGFAIPDVLKVPPISEYGNVIEIANLFGGAAKLREVVVQIQRLLYAA